MEHIKYQMSRPRCRFDLFVHHKPEIASKYNGKPQFTFRGDKFTNDPQQMIKSLLRLYRKRAGQFKMAILYDNTKPKGEPGHEILRIHQGVVEINLLEDYKLMLAGLYYPELLTWQKREPIA